MLFVGCCVLIIVCWLLVVVRCCVSVDVVCRLLLPVVGWCGLCVVCWLLRVDWCLLFAVSCVCLPIV